jgi:hypothetical protein
MSLNRREAMAAGGTVLAAAALPVVVDESLYERLCIEFSNDGVIDEEAKAQARDSAKYGMTLIRRARMAAGLSIAEAAEQTGIDFWQWACLEDGVDEPPTFREGMAICQLLKIDVADLFEAVTGSPLPRA